MKVNAVTPIIVYGNKTHVGMTDLPFPFVNITLATKLPSCSPNECAMLVIMDIRLILAKDVVEMRPFNLLQARIPTLDCMKC